MTLKPGKTYRMTCNTAGLEKGAQVTVYEVMGPIVMLTNGQLVLVGDLAL